MNNIICSLRKFLADKCANIDNTIIKRSRSLSSKHIILYLLHLIFCSSNTDTLVNAHLKVENIIKTTSQAIDKKRNNLDCSYLDNLLNPHIRKPQLFNKNNIYAVD